MPDTESQASVRQIEGVPVIDLEGDIGAQAEPALNAAFQQAIETQPDRLLLNFERVSYMNSTGIAVIVGLLAQARKAHIQVLVCGLSEHYRYIFSITRLTDFMNIHDDEASALAGARTSEP